MIVLWLTWTYAYGPQTEKVGKHAGLVKVLYEQHKAGRRLTDLILKSSTPDALKTAGAKQELSFTISIAESYSLCT